MKDRVDTHFVNAVLDEASRLASLTPFNIPHRSTQDAQLMGFFIPRNSIIISNIYAVHHDPKLLEKPHEFYPGHFLTQDGVYKASEHLIPFSVGRRSCMGEMLAKMDLDLGCSWLIRLFLIFAGVMQAYCVRLADPNLDIKAGGRWDWKHWFNEKAAASLLDSHQAAWTIVSRRSGPATDWLRRVSALPELLQNRSLRWASGGSNRTRLVGEIGYIEWSLEIICVYRLGEWQPQIENYAVYEWQSIQVRMLSYIWFMHYKSIKMHLQHVHWTCVIRWGLLRTRYAQCFCPWFVRCNWIKIEFGYLGSRIKLLVCSVGNFWMEYVVCYWRLFVRRFNNSKKFYRMSDIDKVWRAVTLDCTFFC